MKYILHCFKYEQRNTKLHFLYENDEGNNYMYHVYLYLYHCILTIAVLDLMNQSNLNCGAWRTDVRSSS